METVIVDEQDYGDLVAIESRVDSMLDKVKTDPKYQAFVEMLTYIKTGVPQN